MRRPRPIVTWLAIFLILGSSGAGAFALLRHEPGFYGRCYVEPGPERVKRSNDCLNSFTTLITRFTESVNEPFHIEITQEQFNSFFVEKFVSLGLAGDLARFNIHDPRLALEKDRFRLGFRYGEGRMSTILSYDFRVWLKPNEPNLLLIEILGRKAGAVPVASQQILQEMTELGRKHGFDVRWYRRETNPVAVVRHIGDATKLNAQLTQIAVEPGKVSIYGRGFDRNTE
jgi:hypothetical protein